MSRASFQLPNTQKPSQGPAAISVPMDFTGGKTQVNGDLALEQMTGTLEFVQSIFIDNRLNAQPFTITFSGTSYTIQCKAGRQGIFPVIAANGALSFTAVSNGGVIVPTLFMNVQYPYFIWDV